MTQPKPLPPLERVREALDYDPETGLFTWKIRPAIRIMVGDEAGTLTLDGYRRIIVLGQGVSAGRLAHYIMTGEEPHGVVDHINGIRDDNRWANLQDIPQALNVQKAAISKGGKTSRFRGVSRVLPGSRNKKGAEWQASITAFGKTYHLGSFMNEDDAAAAYAEARERLHR